MPPVERQREVDRVPTGEPRGPKRQAGEPDEQPRPRGRGNAGAGPAGENPLQAWTPRRHGHPSGETGMRVARETPARFQLGPFPRRCWHPPAHKDLCAGTITPGGGGGRTRAGAPRQRHKARSRSSPRRWASLTEAQERVKTRWVLLVGESVLNAVERQLLDFKGEKRQWFNLLNPVLDTDIKPDDRVLYDNWKQRMQKLGATEDDAQSDTDATVGKESKDASASSGESQDHPSAGSDSKGSSVSSDAQNASASSGEHPSTSSDSKGLRKPIIGWKPVRLDDNSWGSKLTGKSVADLPEELDGAPIVVTASKGETWETRIEEVVSRDGNTVIVRDTGKPEARDDGPQTA